jgi:hypothetical protein
MFTYTLFRTLPVHIDFGANAVIKKSSNLSQNMGKNLFIVRKTGSYIHDAWRGFIVNISIFATVIENSDNLSQQRLNIDNFYKIGEISTVDKNKVVQNTANQNGGLARMSMVDWSYVFNYNYVLIIDIPITKSVITNSNNNGDNVFTQTPYPTNLYKNAGGCAEAGKPYILRYTKKDLKEEYMRIITVCRFQVDAILSAGDISLSGSDVWKTIKMIFRCDGATIKSYTPSYHARFKDSSDGSHPEQVHFYIDDIVKISSIGEYSLVLSLELFGLNNTTNDYLSAKLYRLFIDNDSNIDTATDTPTIFAVYTDGDNGQSIKIREDISHPGNEILLTKRILTSYLANGVYPSSDYVYNSRLFYGNCVTDLFSGYNSIDYNGDDHRADGREDGNELYFVTTLRDTSRFEKTVVSKSVANVVRAPAPSPDIQQTRPYYLLPSIIMYPDHRAIETSIYLKNSAGSIFFLRKYPLTPNRTMNMAYSLIYDLRNVAGTDGNYTPSAKNGVFASSQEASHMNEALLFKIETATSAIMPPDTGYITEKNKIMISEPYSPAVLDLQSTVSINGSGVLAFMSNNFSLGDMSFGSFPVFVFTQEGVYALRIGTNVFIEGVSPVSSEIYNGAKNGVIKTLKGIVFISQNGVKLLSGQESVNISKALDNFLKNPLASNSKYKAAVGRHFGTDTDMLSQYNNDFATDYLPGAELFYNIDKDEVVLLNKEYNYSYIFANGFICKTHNKSPYKTLYYNTIHNQYPLALSTDRDGKTIYNLARERLSIGNKPFLVQTNVINITPNNLSKISRIIVNCRITGLKQDEKAGVYMFISDDGFIWDVADMKEVLGSDDIRDTEDGKRALKNFNPLKSLRSAKYAILLVIGKANSPTDYISHIRAEFDNVLDDKIR